MIDTVAEWFGIAKAKLIAGFLGSIVAMAWIKGTIYYRATLFFGGLAAAIYVTPHINALFEIEREGMEFLVGVFSMSTAAAIFRTLEQVDFAGIMEAMKQFFSRGK